MFTRKKMSDCSISFPGPVSRATLSRIVIDYLKYILYYRGQFPLPLDQLKESLIESCEIDSSSTKEFFVNGHKIHHDIEDHKTSKGLVPKPSIAMNRTKQNFVDSISKFDKLFNELLKILETQNVLEIVLNLGPNIMNPKEMYRITLPSQCSEPQCNIDYSSPQKCKLKFFREILHSNLWADLKADSLLPISILLLLESGMALKDNMEQKSFYSFPKSCKQRIVCFSDKCAHIEETSVALNSLKLSDSTASCQSHARRCLWVKLKPDLKGFKSFSETRSRSCSSVI